MARDLARERCLPCEQGTPPLQMDESLALLGGIDGKWRLSEDTRALTREITFKTFGRAMSFLNRVADIAEREGRLGPMLVVSTETTFKDKNAKTVCILRGRFIRY